VAEQLIEDGHAVHEAGLEVDGPGILILGLVQGELQLREGLMQVVLLEVLDG
jgi:hypothetical protein